MTDTSGLWGAGFALLGGAMVLKGVKNIQEEYSEYKEEKHEERKKEGYGLW